MFVRYVIALYDAPIPARAGIKALSSAGVAPADIVVIPELPPAQPSDSDAPRPEIPDCVRLEADLRGRGIPADDAAAYAEGVGRGGVLLFARCATAQAERVADSLAEAGTVDLDYFRALWASAPDVHYEWRDLEPPDLPRGQ